MMISQKDKDNITRYLTGIIDTPQAQSMKTFRLRQAQPDKGSVSA